MTIQECLDAGGHCYVRADLTLMTIPPQYPEKCKHCSASRNAIPQDQYRYVDTTPREFA